MLSNLLVFPRRFNATVAIGLPSHAVKRRNRMGKICFLLLLSSSFLLAQDSNSSAMSQGNSKHSKGEVTVQGCVGRSSGDYILTKQNPGMTYELQGTGKIKLRQYLGQRVEVTGTQSPSMSTSSDAITKTGAPASTTLTISSIRTIAKECSVRPVADQ